MRIVLRQLYRWARFALIASFIAFLLSTIVVILNPVDTEFYTMAIYQGRCACIVMPLAWSLFAVSGLYLLPRKSANGAETRMANIMKRLSPDERDYLQQELDTRLTSVGDDGELLSVDELLGDKDKR